MSKQRKLSAKNIAILTASNITLSVSVGISASYIMDWPSGWTVALVNTLSLTPLLLASGDAIRQEIGLRSPAQITANFTKKRLGREIPINAGDQSSSIFMQMMPQLGSGQDTEYTPPPQLETLTVWYDDNSYTITIPDIEEFLYVAWRRQTQRKNGFSRIYWTEQRRPTITKLEYKIRMILLCSVSGLVVDRGESRSGKLALPPQDAIAFIKNTAF